MDPSSPKPSTSSIKPPNQLLTLEILKIETGLSSSEIKKTVQNLNRITSILNLYSLPPIPKKRDPDEIFSDVLLQLRIAAGNLLYHSNWKKHNRKNNAQNRKQNAQETELSNKRMRYNCEMFSKSNNNNKDFIFTKCYTCNTKLTSIVHSFYPKMCIKCGDFNLKQRTESADLKGKIALVTGGRIKIGYETALKLLRCNALVIITTRFPADATKRYSMEPDFDLFKDRLHIYPLDLRFLKDVHLFCDHLQKTYERLDILIQNAAQTIRRPVAFYKHLLQNESSNNLEYSSLIHSWENQKQITDASSSTTIQCKNKINIPKSSLSSQLIIHPEDLESCQDVKGYFPPGKYDEDLQQLDLRPVNSWLLELDQVDTVELVEVNLVNCIAPFVILNKLTPLLKKATVGDTFGSIVLVSAMEGKFNRLKSTQHPHTNCAKASLNMMVRTSASYYRKYGLLLNAVDTGWVTDEYPLPLKLKRPFKTPIDCVDGAARVLHPVFQTVNHNVAEYGMFFKDYFPTSW